MIFNNPCAGQYWIDKPLNYSKHAKEKLAILDLTLNRYLPYEATLVDVDVDNGNITHVIFHVRGEKSYYIVLNPETSIVITVFEYDKKKYDAWRKSVNKKRKKMFLKERIQFLTK